MLGSSRGAEHPAPCILAIKKDIPCFRILQGVSFFIIVGVPVVLIVLSVIFVKVVLKEVGPCLSQGPTSTTKVIFYHYIFSNDYFETNWLSFIVNRQGLSR